ncbi:MAG: hypothetical protein FJ280_16230 [Planctomycetes bacterium]|nr:hypothetical protein [Planctomycetota bacterium]
MLILVSAYLLRCGIGIGHYLYFFTPNYFDDPSFFAYLWDYQWMHESMILVHDTWLRQGFLTPLPESFWELSKNATLMAYNGLLYYLTGINTLNLAPWNSLHSMYTAAIVGMLALKLGCRRDQAVIALALAAFQPFGMISSTFARDFVGQSWVALAVLLVIATAHRPTLWAVVLPAAGFLAYCQRQPYLAIIIVGTVLTWLFGRRQQRSNALYLWAVLIAIGAFVAREGLLGLAFARFEGVGAYGVQRLFVLPFLMLRGIMGPFPWSQVFDDVPGWEFMPVDFLQHVLNLAVMVCALPVAYRLWRQDLRMDAGFIFWVMFWMSGVIATGVHSGYVSIGMVFLYPLAAQAGHAKLRSALLVSILFFGACNSLYWLAGLKGSKIIMSITGY